jgi:hypothetical protein
MMVQRVSREEDGRGKPVRFVFLVGGIVTQ